MAIHAYTTQAGRVNTIKGEIIGHAQHVEALAPFAQTRKIDKNKGNTVIYASFIPYGAATTNANTINRPSVTASAHVLTEGSAPVADILTRRDITVTLQQFGAVYSWTDQTADLYEDDISGEAAKQLGERMGLLREMIRWGVLKGCTNAFYAGGTTRGTVDEAVSWNFLSKVARNLMANRAKMITKVLSPSANYATYPVEPGFVVAAHTDLEHDIRALPGFIHVASYGSRKPLHDMELGSCGRFRFVLSPELGPVIDSGAAVGSTGLLSTGTTYVDVYPMIVMAEDAWGDVALRGADSMKVYEKKVGATDSGDPLGQKGFIGSKFYMATTILNNGHMAVAECGATSL